MNYVPLLLNYVPPLPSETDIRLLAGIAPLLGVSLRNAGLIQEKQVQLGEFWPLRSQGR